MAEASTWLAAAVMVVVPAAMAIRAAARGVRQVRADGAVAQRESARAAKRGPARGTVTLEGCVEAGAEEPLVGERREHGCLGGPLIYRVPTFRLRLADGRVVSVESGPDPTVNEAWRLLRPQAATSPPERLQVPGPTPTGAGTVYALRGQLRVSGVLPAHDTHFAPPPGHSVTIDVVD